eukprot:gnl/TRDRNA2_/TRDRNA2_91904_c0_seq2.p1 gnl/TRDRNA2_/TRDRNA2_91904_c0~~gnl/TRDRNA2_/TRDRNA2_91904_c0_seq2.p1  ORF type:complete len:290 (-),score=44.96 gnl/TRDRNA2_/TRDRNA2_91904_c0_seq2:125-994(-)
MDGSIKKLFEGEMETYVECCDISYKSKRSESFHDIQLDLRGANGQDLRTIEQSLRKLTAEEILEGDNAYEAEGIKGLQRARKGIRFQKLPPVLTFHLKRFHFNAETMTDEKLNTRFEFEQCINLDAFVSNSGNYFLHTVIVHSGQGDTAHYHAHIRPTRDAGWLKFNDAVVTVCSEKAAVEDNFGGKDGVRAHNAYILTYIREGSWADSGSGVDSVDIYDSKTTFRGIVGCTSFLCIGIAGYVAIFQFVIWCFMGKVGFSSGDMDSIEHHWAECAALLWWIMSLYYVHL